MGSQANKEEVNFRVNWPGFDDERISILFLATRRLIEVWYSSRFRPDSLLEYNYNAYIYIHIFICIDIDLDIDIYVYREIEIEMFVYEIYDNTLWTR